MSETSGIDDQILSLPKGGGAVQGLGTTFETDLNTGTGSFAIPINVPAGPNGIQPRVTIRYHSAAGNGPFGIGWSLGLMAIARKTEGRIPDYGPNDDKFVLVGDEDLVPIGGGRYRSRVDTLHWRIERKGDGWEMTDTRGTSHHLGQTSQGRVETTEDGLTKMAIWFLEEMRDTNGNTVRYFYRLEGAQRYLEHIEWGTYALKFIYEERPDQLSTSRYGFLLKTTLRCTRIELHVMTIAPSLARSWTLDYEQAPGSALSMLRRVTLRGHSADGNMIEAPALTLGYTQFQPRKLQRFSGLVPGLSPDTFGSGRLELLDWDGDGLPDILELGNGRARVWPNLGRGRWGVPRSLPAMPTPVSLDEPGVAFADMEGKGTADLIMLDRPLGGYYPHLPGGGFDRPVYWRQAPATRLTSGDARLVDLNGDGIIDLLVTGDNFFSLYMRNPVNGWDVRPHTIPRQEAPPVSLKDPRVHLADMNGDGLQDLVLVNGEGVTYWPYLGNGRWASAVRMANSPMLPQQFDPKRLYVTDIDGDGCADLVYVDFGRVIIWLNQGGVRIGDPEEIPYTPPARPEQIRLADMNGSGTIGILWSAVMNGTHKADFFYLDLMGSIKPYLLSHIDNGLGLETKILYRSSTEFAIDAAEEGNPWRTFHPFPVHCVAQIETHDKVTDQVDLTRYHYHEARYDGETKTFLGFREVDVETVGDDAIPTLRTHNIYHLGLDPDDLQRHLTADERQRLGALRRRLLRTEVYGLDGSNQQNQPYQIVHHEYDTRVESVANGASVIVPFEKRTLEEQWERGPVPFAFREITYLDIDNFGNILRQRIRVWRAGQSIMDQDVTTEINFAINSEAHIVSLPARITQRDADGAALSVIVTHYDGPPHEGLPEGQVMVGNMTRQDVLVLTDELASAIYSTTQPDWTKLGYHRRTGERGWWITKVSYERQETSTGLTLISRGPSGSDTRLDYDITRQYPSRLTDAAGNVIQGRVDRRVFQMASVMDANSQETVDQFDVLGRVTATIKPEDSESFPTYIYSYRSNGLPVGYFSLRRCRHGETQTLDEHEYFNGHGQLIQRIVPGEGDEGRHFIVQLAQEYTSRGQVSASYLPYYIASSDYASPSSDKPKTQMRYDALGRLIEQIAPSGAHITTAFNPGRIEISNGASSAVPHQKRIIQVLDALGRVQKVLCPLDNHAVQIDYEYDSLNRLVRVRPPDGGEVRLAYDLSGHLLVQENVDAGRIVCVVNAAGSIVQRTAASGETVHYIMDRLERLVEVRQNNSMTPEIVYTYLDAGDQDPPDGSQNRRGRLWRIRDRLGTLTYAYDALGHVSQTRRIVDALGGRELVTDVLYDALGRKIRIMLPEPEPGAGRRVVEYLYGLRGLLAAAPGYIKAAEYDVQGRIIRLVYQNNVENLLDFNALTGLPRRLRVLSPAGTALRDQTFTYDESGNLLNIASPLLLESGQFTYDELDRLIEAIYGSGEHFVYRYSDGGNITHIDGIGNLAYATSGSGAVVAAGSATYTYDTDGRLKTSPYGVLQFDGLDNLVQIKLVTGGTIDYVYDFNGQRVIKRTSRGSEFILADPHVEFHDGHPIIWITFGEQRILCLVGASGLFLHPDILGTLNLYTDMKGMEVRRLAFGPYGTLRFDSAAGAGLPGGPRFTGQLSDDETGLICLGRRYYDPRIGRFISADRVVPGIYQLDAWNSYVYGHNNPLRYTDPTGFSAATNAFAIYGIALLVTALLVAGIFTAGATWVVAGVTIHVGGLLVTTSIGIAGGAIIGGIAAAKAGGNVTAGILFGGFVGGVSALLGGALSAGAMSYPMLASALGSNILGYIGGGAMEGAMVGAGTGVAIGFSGGKGESAIFWLHVAKGAAWGAISGALLGTAIKTLVEGNQVFSIFTFRKFYPDGSLTYWDNAGSAGIDTGTTLAKPNFWDLLPEFLDIGKKPASFLWSEGAIFNFPIAWVPNAAMRWGGLVAVIDISISADTFSPFSYSRQLVLGLNAIPILDWAIALIDFDSPKYYEDVKSRLQSIFSMHDQH